MFVEALETLLSEQCPATAVRAIEAGGSPLALWQSLQDSGFLELLAPESAGGAALTLAELHPVIVLFGHYAVPVPVAQAIAARALLGSSQRLPDGMITLAPAAQRQPDGRLRCPLVPYGGMADFILAELDETLLLLPCATAQRISTGIAGSLAATCVLDLRSVVLCLDSASGSLQTMGAALHASLLAGAMSRVLDMTLCYCNDRVQFGRPIGKLQAVQHQLSIMVEHVAAASMAAQLAWRTPGPLPAALPAAIAKARASEAAARVAAIGHALHGAIGIAKEYDLQLFTRRLHEWRATHGGPQYWNRLIGRALLESSPGSCVEFVRRLAPLRPASSSHATPHSSQPPR